MTYCCSMMKDNKVRNRNSDVEITTTVAETQPVTTLHVAFYGIDGDDGRLPELMDLIDRWSDDNLGIVDPPHGWATHRVPVTHEAGGKG